MGGRGLAFAFTLALVLCPSCEKAPAAPWAGSYLREAEGEGPASLVVGETGEGVFPFLLTLLKENGYSLEIAGTAKVRGRSASYDGPEGRIDFSLDEGEAPSVGIEAKGGSIEAEGFAASMRFARRKEGPGEGAATPSQAPSETPPPPEGEFRPGYYLPDGVLSGEALPESLPVLLFDGTTSILSEFAMFEGMMTEGKVVGTFSVDGAALRIRPRGGTKGEILVREWKRTGRDALIDGSGQRYRFWQESLTAE